MLIIIALLALGSLLGYLFARWSLRLRMNALEETAKRIDAKVAGLAAKKRPAWLGNLAPQPGSAGWTIVAALNGLGCLGRSRSDEPVFVLCARDKAASMLVRDWATMVEKMGANREKVADARALADRMEQWREANGGGKVPD